MLAGSAVTVWPATDTAFVCSQFGIRHLVCQKIAECIVNAIDISKKRPPNMKNIRGAVYVKIHPGSFSPTTQLVVPCQHTSERQVRALGSHGQNHSDNSCKTHVSKNSIVF